MQINFKELISLLEKHGAEFLDGVAPHEALYVGFSDSIDNEKQCMRYETADGGRLVVEIDENGKVLGIEII